VESLEALTDAGPEGAADPERDGGEAAASGPGEPLGPAETALFEQWLEQLEGDPRVLLKNQFTLQEQRAEQRQRGPFVENRPW